MPRWSEALSEGAIREIGGPIIREIGSWILTGLSGVTSSIVSGGWTYLLDANAHRLPPQLTVKPDEYQQRVLRLVVAQVFEATGVVLLMAFAMSIIWIALVRLHPPSSPTNALRYRMYWLAIAVTLLACTALLYNLGPFPNFNDLQPIGRTLLVLQLMLSGLLFLYIMSMLRSPPTVIASVPLGAYAARIRWR